MYIQWNKRGVYMTSYFILISRSLTDALFVKKLYGWLFSGVHPYRHFPFPPYTVPVVLLPELSVATSYLHFNICITTVFANLGVRRRIMYWAYHDASGIMHLNKNCMLDIGKVYMGIHCPCYLQTNRSSVASRSYQCAFYLQQVY